MSETPQEPKLRVQIGDVTECFTALAPFLKMRELIEVVDNKHPGDRTEKEQLFLSSFKVVAAVAAKLIR